MTASDRTKLLDTGAEYLREVIRDNRWWLRPKATILSGPSQPPPLLRAPPTRWNNWAWLRESEDLPGFISWYQRGHWLFGHRVRLEFFTGRPTQQKDFLETHLEPSEEERCLQYHQMLVGRRSPWVYGVLGIGKWRGQLFRVWEKRDEVTSLTRALPLLMSYPHLILRVCRDLVSIYRALPENQAAFPYAALSWLVLENERLALARLPYDHSGNGAQISYQGTCLQVFWDLAHRQGEIQRALNDKRIRGQGSQDHLGNVLYALLHRRLSYQGHSLFHYQRRVLVATRREFYTAGRHSHLFAGSPELRNIILRMSGMRGAPFPTINAALGELEAQLDVDIRRTESRCAVPWRCGERWD